MQDNYLKCLHNDSGKDIFYSLGFKPLNSYYLRTNEEMELREHFLDYLRFVYIISYHYGYN